MQLPVVQKVDGKGIVKSNRHTDVILYVSDGVAASKSVLNAIEAAEYDVVSTNSYNQAFALLFIMHSATAVVLDLQATEQSSFDFARRLRAIQPDVQLFYDAVNTSAPCPHG